MNKPDYLTQEQYDYLFSEIDNINPSWRFCNKDMPIETSMAIWNTWINGVTLLTRKFDSEGQHLIKIMQKDKDLMRQVDDYIALLQL